MKKSTFIIILLGVVLLVYLYQKANAVKNITLNLGKPKKFGSDGFAFGWIQNIEADNTESTGININSISAKIFNVEKIANKDVEREIGTVKLINQIKLKPNSVTEIPAQVRIAYANIAGIITSTIEGIKNKVLRFRIRGVVRGESLQIPINEDFNYLIPQF